MNLEILLLAAYGLTFALRAGKVSLVTDLLVTLPFFRAMFACVLCTGTEVGWGLYTLTHFYWDWRFLPNCFAFGLASGAFCLLAEEVYKFLNRPPPNG